MSRDPMQPEASDHEAIQILMMGHLDGELDPEQERRMKEHTASCAACALELARFQRLQDMARAVRLREPSDLEWERFHRGLYNRLERRTAWILAGIGLALTAGGLAYSLLINDAVAPWVRAAIAASVAGFALLFGNVWRERRLSRRLDRYREVRR